MMSPSSLMEGVECGNLADVAIDDQVGLAADGGVLTADRRVPTADRGMPTADQGVPTADRAGFAAAQDVAAVAGLPADAAELPADAVECGRLLGDPMTLPEWLRPITDHVDGAPLPSWVRHATGAAPTDVRRGAVLILLADGASGPDLLLTARAATLRSHAGQPAFPGGEMEPGEDAVAAALREAQEETGLDPASVTPAAELPGLYLAPSRFLVRPVLGHWREPGPVYPVDPAETAQVARIPIADLAAPENRGMVVSPGVSRRLRRTAAFAVGGMVVWGFTAGLVDLLLTWGGWSQPWDRDRVLELPGIGDTPVRPGASARPAAGTPPGSAGA